MQYAKDSLFTASYMDTILPEKMYLSIITLHVTVRWKANVFVNGLVYLSLLVWDFSSSRLKKQGHYFDDLQFKCPLLLLSFTGPLIYLFMCIDGANYSFTLLSSLSRIIANIASPSESSCVSAVTAGRI